MTTEALTWGLLGVLIVKEFISLFFSRHRDNVLALQDNTMAIIELKIELRHMKQAIEEVPKLRKDIDAAHEKLRQRSLT